MANRDITRPPRSTAPAPLRLSGVEGLPRPGRKRPALARIQAGEGTLGRLSRDTTLYSEAVETVRTLRTLLADVQKNPRRYFQFSVF